ncbi:synaptotagmin-like protein 2 isoform X2 [Gadus macrocephalus]|uniref:synaptotagmin-like protein 2 isoform X2 n=1 Tax=Gadus macrocephalus TaxID=80720 RepID=UPI0028CB1E92|nr:synaptotagmin-like protein 2 isoform X2 [Gadus macrocephalus]
MIDLSHLTDEEQERILKVLNRDTELKRHEEERVSNLQKLLDRGKQSETKLKYLTGEWFYEAKSRRHKDRIHGSEIILASMKQRRKSNVDLTLSTAEASVKPSLSSPRVSHSLAPPPKPARLLDTPLLVKKRVLDAESNQTQAASQSPGRPRRNPFNRASFIVVEPNEKTEEPIVTGDQRAQKSPDTEPMAPLKDPTACHSTPGGSLSSEASSTGVRPVPKMRTFASRRSSTLSNNAPGHDLPGDTKVMVPAPRLSLKYASQSVVASPSSDRSVESPAQGTEASQVSRFSPHVVAAKCLQRPTEELRKEEPAEDLTKNIPSVTPETNIASTKRDGPNAIGRVSPKKTRDAKPKEYGDSLTTSLSTNETKEPERWKVSNGGSSSASAPRDEDLSMTQSVVDQPVRYDLNLIEKAYQHTAPSSVPKPKLSHQISTASEGEEGSIAKVLEWFSRSTDSNDWLDIEDSQPTVINLDRKEDVKVKGTLEDRMRDDHGSHVVEMKKDHLVKESNEVKENMEKKRESRVVREDVEKNARQEAKALSIEDKGDGNLAGKISNAKLPGPKILNIISDRAISDKRQKPEILQMDELRQKETNDQIVEHLASAPERVKYNKSTFKDKTKQTPTSNSQGETDFLTSSGHNIQTEDIKHKQPDQTNKKDTSIHPEPLIYPSLTNHRNKPNNTKKDRPNYAADLLILQTNPEVLDRRGSDNDLQSALKASQYRASPLPDKPLLTLLSSSITTPQEDEFLKAPLETTLQMKDIPDHDKLRQAIPSPSMDYKRSGGNALSTTKPQTKSHGNEDTKSKVIEDGAVKTGMAPKKDFMQNRVTSRLPLGRQESKVERIRELKSLWEKEMNKQVLLNVKSKDGGDGKMISTSNLSKSKRFSKSEYNLRSMGKDTDNDLEDSNGNMLNFTQRQETSTPSLGTNSSQFNNLREFWGSSNFSRRGSFMAEKANTHKNKEILDSQSLSSELQPSAVTEKSSFRPAPPAQSGQPKDNRIELKENPREEETSTKLQSNVGKKIQSPKARTDSFGNISSRTSAMRRSTSMFSLNVSKEQDCGKKSQEGVMRQSADKSQHRRQSDGRVSSTRRPSVNSESQALRARAFVPRDYRHYLGMTEKSSVHNSLAPVVSEQGSDGKAYDFDLCGPARETSPVGSEERYGRTGGKASQRVNNSSSDTGRESSLSSTASETRSNSRTSSNWENDSEDQNPVKRALRRAELKNKTKSLEDITSFGSSTWQERRPDPSDMRRSKNATSVSTASTASFSDPDHMKNMSKSVPSFLQKERSGSVMTMYSGDFGNVDVTGNIQFSINYVQKLTEFHIFVAQCQGLAAVDPKRGRSDPYVKSYLVPDKASLGKRKTAVKKKTLNPTFNEILRYRVHKEYLRTQTLILSVWHHDTFGKNSFLGEVDLDLSTWDFDHTQMNYLDLRARMPSSVTPSDNRGEMRLAIRFLPQVTTTVMMHGPPTGEIHIWVKECNNLPLIRATMDPYVKCFVLPDTSRKGRQKTRVLRRTTNPIFNHTMVYDGIKQADLTEACVELTVWDRDRLASNLLGGLRLGLGTGRSYGVVVNWMDSSLCELRLWERMMASPNEWVEELLPLRRLTSAKTALK